MFVAFVVLMASAFVSFWFLRLVYLAVFMWHFAKHVCEFSTGVILVGQYLIRLTDKLRIQELYMPVRFELQE